MTLEQLFELHEALICTSDSVMLNQPERRKKERREDDYGVPVERRRKQRRSAGLDKRKPVVTDAGRQWLKDLKRYESGARALHQAGTNVEVAVANRYPPPDIRKVVRLMLALKRQRTGDRSPVSDAEAAALERMLLLEEAEELARQREESVRKARKR